MSESRKSHKSSSASHSQGSAVRPFSFKPQDFGAPEPTRGPRRVEEEQGEKDVSSGVHHTESQLAPEASGASPHSRLQEEAESHKVARKEEHTILMAVPPPAQVNKGD